MLAGLLIVSVAQMLINFYNFYMLGIKFLTRVWTIVDIVIFVITCWITDIYYQNMTKTDIETGNYTDNYETYKDFMMRLRVLIVIG